MTMTTEGQAAIIEAAWHVHTPTDPYCRAWWNENAEERARARAADLGGALFGPLPYNRNDCPYRQEKLAAAAAGGSQGPHEGPPTLMGSQYPVVETAEVPATSLADIVLDEEETPVVTTAVDQVAAFAPAPAPDPAALEAEKKLAAEKLAEARAKRRALEAKGPSPLPSSSLDLSTVVCDECGEPMNEHTHPVKGATAAAAPPPQPKRRAKTDKVILPCPHCKGPQHYNEAGLKVNGECMFRQMLIANGAITDPLTERVPSQEAADFVRLGRWIETQISSGYDLRYGGMPAVDGSAGGTKAARDKAAKVLPDPESAPSMGDLASITLDDAEPEAPTPAEAVVESDPTPAPDPAAEAEAEKAERDKLRRDKLKNLKR